MTGIRICKMEFLFLRIPFAANQSSLHRLTHLTSNSARAQVWERNINVCAVRFIPLHLSWLLSSHWGLLDTRVLNWIVIIINLRRIAGITCFQCDGVLRICHSWYTPYWWVPNIRCVTQNSDKLLVDWVHENHFCVLNFTWKNWTLRCDGCQWNYSHMSHAPIY